MWLLRARKRLTQQPSQPRTGVRFGSKKVLQACLALELKRKTAGHVLFCSTPTLQVFGKTEPMPNHMNLYFQGFWLRIASTGVCLHPV